MFKLIDIIKGGGSNPKLNKFLNRYVISKKEKTNLIKEIKNSKGASSDSFYFIIYRNGSLETIFNSSMLGMLMTTISGASSETGGYTYYINLPTIASFVGVFSQTEKYLCGKITYGHKESYKSDKTLPGMPLNVDVNSKEDIYTIIANELNVDINAVKNVMIEITEEQFFDKEWLLEQAQK